MSHPIILTALGGSGVPLFFQCSDCGALYHPANRGVAEQCCSAAAVNCIRPGCEQRREKGRTLCQAHGEEHRHERERALFDQAVTVTESEQVTNGDGDYWPDVDAYVDEQEPGTPAHYLWATKRVHLLVDADRIIQNIVENWWSCDDAESPELNGIKEFTTACLQFQSANAGAYLYEPDYTRKLRVDAVPLQDAELVNREEKP